MNTSDMLYGLINMSRYFQKGLVKYDRSTYDKADPTAFQKVTFWAVVAYDPLFYGPDDEPDGPPPSAIYEITLHDLTWGCKVTLAKIVDAHGNHKKWEAYFDWQSATWSCGEELEKMLTDCLTGSEFVTEKEFKNFWLDLYADAEEFEENEFDVIAW